MVSISIGVFIKTSCFSLIFFGCECKISHIRILTSEKHASKIQNLNNIFTNSISIYLGQSSVRFTTIYLQN